MFSVQHFKQVNICGEASFIAFAAGMEKCFQKEQYNMSLQQKPDRRPNNRGKDKHL
jgi:hypothetical protein